MIAYNAGQWTNDVAGNGRIDALITQSQTALNRLQANASQYSVNLSILQCASTTRRCSSARSPPRRMR